MAAVNAKADTITVDINTDGSLASLDQTMPGDPNFNGPCSLREAINNAVSTNPTPPSNDCEAGDPSGPDIIQFSGVSTINLAAVDTNGISVGQDVTIQGPITISGANITRIFRVSSSDGALRLNQVTLQNGNGNSASGGAILQDVGSLVECEGSVFKNNKAENSGGAIHTSGTLNIDNCSFENNEAGNHGGAIYKDSGSNLVATLSITNTNFSENLAGTDPAGQTNGGAGGAIYFTGSSIASITSTRFNKNKADGADSSGSGGGAIFNGAVLNIFASAFAGNEVTGDDWHGGAIYNNSAQLAVNFSHFGTTPLPFPPPFEYAPHGREVKGGSP